MHVLFLGMGFSSLATAQLLRQRHPDAHITGTSRTPEGAAALLCQGFGAVIFDGETVSDVLAASIGMATHIVHSIPPGPAGDPVLLAARPALDAASKLLWLGYFSTIGVYGGAAGEWVDETTPPQPRNARARQRVEAEAAWRAFGAAHAVPVAVLRLAGIYGPGRSALDKLRDGTARRIVKPGQVFNRIHVADIATITARAAERNLAGTFNLADDEPAPPQDLITHAADLLGMAPPPAIDFDTADLNPMQRSFYEDNKRVSNSAIKEALGLTLRYPDFRTGLKAILSS